MPSGGLALGYREIFAIMADSKLPTQALSWGTSGFSKPHLDAKAVMSVTRMEGLTASTKA